MAEENNRYIQMKLEKKQKTAQYLVGSEILEINLKCDWWFWNAWECVCVGFSKYIIYWHIAYNWYPPKIKFFMVHQFNGKTWFWIHHSTNNFLLVLYSSNSAYHNYLNIIVNTMSLVFNPPPPAYSTKFLWEWNIQ